MAKRNKHYLGDDDRWMIKGGFHEEVDMTPEICPDCRGYGTVFKEDPRADRFITIKVDCNKCEGEGVL